VRSSFTRRWHSPRPTRPRPGNHQHRDAKTGKTIALDALLDEVSPADIANLRGAYSKFRERFRSETPLGSA